jgi:hypothetical protein
MAKPLKPLGQVNRNFVGNIYGMSSKRFADFFVIRYQKWLPQAILVSDWLISKKSSLKLPGQMNRNLVGSICMYGRLCKLPVVAIFVNRSRPNEQSL